MSGSGTIVGPLTWSTADGADTGEAAAASAEEGAGVLELDTGTAAPVDEGMGLDAETSEADGTATHPPAIAGADDAVSPVGDAGEVAARVAAAVAAGCAGLEAPGTGPFRSFDAVGAEADSGVVTAAALGAGAALSGETDAGDDKTSVGEDAGEAKVAACGLGAPASGALAVAGIARADAEDAPTWRGVADAEF